MGLFDQFPYTNFHELNLDWLIRLIKELENTVNNFVALNTIKYADPIQWNITTQYQANTVVVDPQTGTAYISSKAVPAGVALTNTEYWSVIFTLDIISANKNLTLRDDGSNVLATFASAAGDWLIWNGTLYKVSQTININEAYVEGYNLERHTVEQFIDDYIGDIETTIQTILNDIANIRIFKNYATVSDMTDDTNLVAGDIVFCAGYHSENDGGALHYIISANDAGHGIAFNSLYANPIFPSLVTPEMFGAYGDGVTDDATAIQSALNYSNNLHFNSKTYAANTSIQIPAGSTVTGESGTIIMFNSAVGFQLLGQLVIFDNMHIECSLSRTNNTIAIYDGGNTRVARSRFSNLWLRNWTKGFSLNGGYNDNMIIDNIEFSLVNNCIEIYHGDASKITNIVAEPFINYVVAGVYCNAMTIENVIATGERDEYTNNPSVAFILLSDGSADKKLGINIKIDTVFCERVNYVLKSDCPYLEINNVYVNETYAAENVFQIHNGFSGVPNNDIKISNCWCTNYNGEFLYTLDSSPNEMIGDVRYRAAVGRPYVAIENCSNVTFTVRSNAPAPYISDKNGIGVPTYTTSALPASAFTGQIVFDSTADALKVFNGTSWV